MLNRTSPPDLFVSLLEDSASIPILTGRWKQRAFGFHLPSTLQGYLFFVLCLLILAFTMALHVTLSAENMRLDLRLATLQEEYARTERINANLVWEISQSTSLAQVYAQASAAGYAPITEFKYLVMAPETAGAAPSATPSTWGTDQWTVEPSAANPVIVLGATAAAGGASQSASALIQTPGMEMALAPAATLAPAVQAPAAQAPDAATVQDEPPAWRAVFSWQGVRAAASETRAWIQQHLPRRR